MSATGSPVRISFEIVGPNDPDGQNQPGSDSPEAPDFSCFINPGASSCTGSYPAIKSGTDSITGWIDHDGKSAVEGGNTEIDQNEIKESDNPDPIFDPNEPNGTDIVDRTSSPAGTNLLDCDDSAAPDTEREVNPHSSGAGSNETYFCKVTDQFGNPKPGVTVNGENESGINDPDAIDGASYSTPDYSCSSAGAQGQCSVVVNQAENEVGTAVICFWLGTTSDGTNQCSPTPANGNQDQELTGENQASDGSDAPNDIADQVELDWETRGASRLEAELETDVNPLGTSHTITAAVYDQSGAPFVSNTQIKFEFFAGSPSDADVGSDGNAPLSADKQCVTSNSATCSISYTHSGTTGSDLICVFVNNTPVMQGNNTNGTCDGDTLNESGDSPGSFEAPEPEDDQDIVQKTWQSPGAATQLDCTPETANNPTGTSHTISCNAQSSGQTTTAGVRIDAEALGRNDPDGGYTPETPDFTCNTASNGTCSFNHGQTQTASVNTNSSGLTTYVTWIDADGSNTSSEADPTEGRNESSEPGSSKEPDGTDVVEKTWVAEGRSITCEPRTATNDTGTSHEVTCTVRDRTGSSAAGEGVTFSEEGTGFITSSTQATSDSNGLVRVSATSPDPGAQTVTATITDDLSGTEPSEVDECDRAANDPQGAIPGQCSDSVSKTWVDAPTGRCDIVGTRRDDRLRGTRRGDVICGRGGNDTLIGRGGNDTLRGGSGKDRLEGGKGRDKLVAGKGNDKLFGNGGKDQLKGGPGRDSCDGGPGRDRESGCENQATKRAAARRRYV